MGYRKCSPESGFCETLAGLVQPDYGSKGLVVFSLLNFETLDKIVCGVVYRKKAGGKGILLKMCPFCGESLKGFLPKEEQPNE